MNRRKALKRTGKSNQSLESKKEEHLIRERQSLVRKYRESGKIARPEELKNFINIYVSDKGYEDRNYERNLKIIALYINKVKVSEIARRSGLSDGTIYNILSRYKIRRLPMDKETANRYKKVLRVVGRKIEEGKDIKAISEELGMNEEKVNQFVNKFLSDLYSKKMAESVEAKSSEVSLKSDNNSLSEFKVPVGKEVSGVSSDKEREERIKGNVSNDLKEAEDIREEKRLAKERKEKEIIYRKGTFGEKGIIPNDVDDEEYEIIMKLVGKEEVSLTGTERKILMYLRAALKYSAEAFDMTDYSKDQFLVPDYVLPIDIILMKDISERFNNVGESVEEIALYHRISVDLVTDVLNGVVSRDEFRKRFFSSLMDIIEAIQD